MGCQCGGERHSALWHYEQEEVVEVKRDSIRLTDMMVKGHELMQNTSRAL
jgi:hypothetical protein